MDSGARRSQNSNRRVPSMRIEGDEEFQEEDVWSVLREGETSGPDMRIPKSYFSSSSSSTSSSSSPWNIHRSKEVSGEKQSSAPMNVPDWSKVYGNTKSNRRSSHMHSNDDGDDDDDGCMVPPHEWVARKLARRQISSFSMCEGVGRTLKGRDLSKMRNAVLTKTGFLE
ncbi:hypothetical protein EUTSA_v10029023mg [Eutrema salsugineum]|uniref:Senescence regulator S40 n=1 Tax=Eutrema salsugineum TaxID=72664 RepID=V4MZQ4_EUTSA|nr:uncharacterized protein LOC18014641 [Eutrema salsugineum]ESQ38131.1 hypothetical protein EUTSA_v10029023mg [Eutrema salsugineum]